MECLKGYGVTLRPLTHADIEMVRCWRNDPRIARYMHFRDTITREMQEEWFRSINNDRHAFFIVEIGDEPVGMTEYKNIDLVEGKAEGGIFIHKEEYRNGLYPFAVIAIKHVYGFNTLGLRELYSYVLDNNKRAIRFNETIGYVPARTVRQGNKRLYILTKERFLTFLKRYKPVLDAHFGYWEAG